MTNRLLLASLLFSMSACAADTDTDDTTVAEETVESAMTGQSEAAIAASLAIGSDAATPAEAALKIGAGANLTPAGCATITTSGATTTVVLANCSGSRGLVNVSGTVVVQVTGVTPVSVSFTATASDLQVDGAVLDLDLDATYRSVNGTTSVDVSSRSSGTGPRGHAITHTGDYVATWDASCASVDGAWATSNELARRSLDVSLSRCRTGCPTGSVSRTRADGTSLTIEFDGTATARFEGSVRGTGTIALACTP